MGTVAHWHPLSRSGQRMGSHSIWCRSPRMRSPSTSYIDGRRTQNRFPSPSQRSAYHDARGPTNCRAWGVVHQPGGPLEPPSPDLLLAGRRPAPAVRRSASFAISSARRRARSERPPSASSWIRHATRRNRNCLFEERLGSPKTSAYLCFNWPTVIDRRLSISTWRAIVFSLVLNAVNLDTIRARRHRSINSNCG